jgi:hypothetical protein
MLIPLNPISSEPQRADRHSNHTPNYAHGKRLVDASPLCRGILIWRVANQAPNVWPRQVRRAPCETRWRLMSPQARKLRQTQISTRKRGDDSMRFDVISVALGQFGR